MKYFLLLLAIGLAACSDPRKVADDADKIEAARIDSVAAELEKSVTELESTTESTKKDVDELLKDM